MTNTYYSISPTTDTMLAIKNALLSKYGAGVTIHFQSATDLVFSCSALSNKVIKINYSTSRFAFYYGDSWTSGTTLTNSITWVYYNTGGCVFIDMVLGDNTLMICANQGSNTNGTLYIIGKLTNGDYAVFSANGGISSSVYVGYLAKNTTDNVDIYPICFSDAFAASSGKLFKQPLILQRSDGAVELNADNTIASFRDIYNCSHALASNVDLVGSNYLMSSAGLFTSTGKRLWTSIIAEF